MVLFLCMLTETPKTNSPASSTSDVTSTKRTTPPSTSSTTLKATQQDAGEDACAGFDAASFVGGIVLMGGFFSIGFFAYKFWQATNEHNYHTL